MKRIKTIGMLILFLWALNSLKAQSLVATDPLPRNVVLEDFSGIRCGYCPAAHELAQEMKETYPNRVVVLTIHQGSFAEPEGDEPDYRTVWGDSLAELAGVYAYPTGTVNRHLFTGDNTAMSTNHWNVSAQQIMSEISPVNVGIETSYDSISRELEIHVELYYTASSLYQTNLLNLALIQSHIIGPQLGGSANNYEHMYMLRDLITGQWGDTIGPAVQGSFIEKDYTYTVPASVNDIPVVVEDCDVAVFVSETKNEIYTGDVVPAVNGSNRYIGNISVADTVRVKRGSSGGLTDFTLIAKSALAGEEQFLVTLEAEEVPYDWNVSFSFDCATYTDTALITMPQNSEEQLIFEIIPGQTAAYTSYMVRFQSLTYPDAPYRYCKFHVISGVTDLVTNGTGGEESVMYAHVFTDGLKHASCNTYAVISADDFVTGLHDRAFEDIKNIYLNIAWTFPALTIEQINAVESFMDNGGNVLISGQDIGWDFMSDASGSHGSPEARGFYTSYLHADYIRDGTSADYIILPDSSDPVYKQVPGFFLVDIYDGNIYPDNIAARAGADEIFYYQSNNNAAAVKAVTQNYKVMYFAAGIEMIGHVSVSNQIISLTNQWFNGLLSTEEYEGRMAELWAGNCVPDPAQHQTTIPYVIQRDGVLHVFDFQGAEKLAVPLKKGEHKMTIDVRDWDPGVYFYRITSGSAMGMSRKFVIAR